MSQASEPGTPPQDRSHTPSAGSAGQFWRVTNFIQLTAFAFALFVVNIVSRVIEKPESQYLVPYILTCGTVVIVMMGVLVYCQPRAAGFVDVIVDVPNRMASRRERAEIARLYEAVWGCLPFTPDAAMNEVEIRIVLEGRSDPSTAAHPIRPVDPVLLHIAISRLEEHGYVLQSRDRPLHYFNMEA